MGMRVRPANPGGSMVGVMYLAIAVGIFLVTGDGGGAVLDGPLVVNLALCGVVVVVLGWFRPTVRWTEERLRRRRVTVVVLLVFSVLVLTSWAFDAAVSRSS